MCATNVIGCKCALKNELWGVTTSSRGFFPALVLALILPLKDPDNSGRVDRDNLQL